MSSATIGLNIVASNLAGSAFGSIFSALATLGTLAAASGASLGTGVLGPLMDISAAAIGAGAAFAVFGEGLRTAIDAGAQLQQAGVMASIAVSDGKQHVDELEQSIVNLANTSQYKIADVDLAFRTLGGLGFDTAQILGGLGEQAIVLAQAMGGPTAGISAADAAHLLGQSLYLFSSQGLDAKTAADELTGAFYNNMMSVADLTQFIGMAGGAANSLGISLQTLLTFGSALTPMFGSASSAGAAMSYLMTNLTTPATAKQADEIKRLGLNVFDANGNFVGLQAVMDQLLGKLQGMNQQDRLDAISLMFNVRSGRAARDLMTMTADEFDKMYDRIYGRIGQVGQAQKDSDAINETAAGAWNRLTTSVNDFFAKAGKIINEWLIPVYDWLNNIFSTLQKNQGFEAFLARFLLLGTVIGGATVVVLGLVAVFALLIPALPVLGVLLGTAMDAFLGVTVAAGVLALVWKNASEKGTALHDVLDFLGVAAHSAGTDLGNLRDFVLDLWNKMQPWLKSLQDITQEAGDHLIPALKQFGDALGRVKDSIPQDQLDTLGTWLKVIGAFLGGVFLIVLVSVVTGIIGFAAAVITFFAGLVSSVLSAGVLIIDTIRTVGAVIDDMRTGHMERAQSDWNAGWAQMTTDAQQFTTNFSDMVTNTVQSLQTTGDMAKSIGTSIGDGLYNGFINSMNSHYDGYARSSTQVAYTIGRSLQFQSPPKEGPLSDSDKWGGRLIDLLTTGMEGKLPSLQATTARVAGAMTVTPGMTQAQTSAAVYAAQAGGYGHGGQGTIEVPVYLDGREIARTTFDVIKGQLKGMGLSRLYK